MFRVFWCFVLLLWTSCHLLGSVSASTLPAISAHSCLSACAHVRTHTSPHALTQSHAQKPHMCTYSPHIHSHSPTHTQMHPQHTYSPHTPLHIVYTSPAHPHLNKPTTLRSLRKVSLCCDCVALTPSAQQPQCPWTCRTVPKERSFVSRAGGKSVPYTWYLHGQRDRSPPKGCLRRCGSFSALG